MPGDHQENRVEENALEECANAFKNFCSTIAKLRDPEGGCPWDLKQTHKTLRRYMIEEAYEAAAAMQEGNDENICDELGDVLLQVVLNAQIADDEDRFTLEDVIKAIDSKMVRRHPHVFSASKELRQIDDEALDRQWQEIKQTEKIGINTRGEMQSIFEEPLVRKNHPASCQAFEIGKIASKASFDWDSPKEVFKVLKDEFFELEEAWNSGSPPSFKHLLEEISDVYFTLAQFCRHLGEDPELVAQSGNDKFLKRFATVEHLARLKGITLEKASKDEIANLWHQAKAQ